MACSNKQFIRQVAVYRTPGYPSGYEKPGLEFGLGCPRYCDSDLSTICGTTHRIYGLISDILLYFFFLSLFQQIDGEGFLLLTQNDIVNILKIKLGPALKIFNTIPKH